MPPRLADGFGPKVTLPSGETDGFTPKYVPRTFCKDSAALDKYVSNMDIKMVPRAGLEPA